MSRLADWYITQQLGNMGWPKTKGLLRKTPYVLAQLVDLVIQQGLQICMGLGAGRPELGGRIIADIFSDNSWTPETTNGLLEMLAKGDQEVASRPDQLPWAALYGPTHHLAAWRAEVPWELLGSKELSIIRSSLCARAAFWGLTHEPEMPAAFQEAKRQYENTAKEWVPHGLHVPMEFPWPTLEVFYETGEELVRDFETQRPPLAPIPPALRNTSLLVSRLGAP